MSSFIMQFSKKYLIFFLGFTIIPATTASSKLFRESMNGRFRQSHRRIRKTSKKIFDATPEAPAQLTKNSFKSKFTKDEIYMFDFGSSFEVVEVFSMHPFHSTKLAKVRSSRKNLMKGEEEKKVKFSEPEDKNRKSKSSEAKKERKNKRKKNEPSSTPSNHLGVKPSAPPSRKMPSSNPITFSSTKMPFKAPSILSTGPSVIALKYEPSVYLVPTMIGAPVLSTTLVPSNAEPTITPLPTGVIAEYTFIPSMDESKADENTTLLSDSDIGEQNESNKGILIVSIVGIVTIFIGSVALYRGKKRDDLAKEGEETEEETDI